jgi:DNA-binding response OmpR family regulator
MSKGFSRWDNDGWKFCWWVICLVGCVNSGSYRVECDGEKAGFKAEIATSGEDMLNFTNKNTYSLILLDLNLGDKDGLSLLKRLRFKGDNTPVIIESGRSDEEDTIEGLNLGAQDYVTKPFNAVLLGGKIKALIRRTSASSSQTGRVKVGPFTLDRSTMRLFKNNEELFLSAKEMILMQLFMTHPNNIFSKNELYEAVWGVDVVNDMSLIVYINHLRNKIEDNPKKPIYLKTSWGLGYVFAENINL